LVLRRLDNYTVFSSIIVLVLEYKSLGLDMNDISASWSQNLKVIYLKSSTFVVQHACEIEAVTQYAVFLLNYYYTD